MAEGLYDYNQEPQTLTAEMLRDAVKKLMEEQLEVHIHVVHPHSKGWTRCGNCFAPVYVGEGVMGRG